LMKLECSDNSPTSLLWPNLCAFFVMFQLLSGCERCYFALSSELDARLFDFLFLKPPSELSLATPPQTFDVSRAHSLFFRALKSACVAGTAIASTGVWGAG